jgi:dTDP-glucose pyrophosphorylase
VSQKLFCPKWQLAIVSREATIEQALSAINSSGALMACVVSDDGVLEAILTDSDIRRSLLNGESLDSPAWPWANKKPVVAYVDMSVQELALMAEMNGVRDLPIVDRLGRLSDIFALVVNQQKIETESPSLSVNSSWPELPNAILIQAGGLGTRLRSVVGDKPKPLALVGDRPILETLIFQAAANGFRQVYVSVNYMADLIEEHLSDRKYGELDIRIVRETKRLGTAGCIGMIADEVKAPLLVCNADVLTTAPFRSIIMHHEKEKADITLSVRPYRMTIPYGVVDINNGWVTCLTEKPERTFLVNAGICVLAPEICRLVEKQTFTDMPDLISKAMTQQMAKVTPYLLHEYWIDIGRPEDFYRANQDFETFFGNQVD